MDNPKPKEEVLFKGQETQAQKDQNLRRGTQEKPQQESRRVDAPQERKGYKYSDEFIDQCSMDSFPSSDPPATY